MPADEEIGRHATTQTTEEEEVCIYIYTTPQRMRQQLRGAAANSGINAGARCLSIPLAKMAKSQDGHFSSMSQEGHFPNGKSSWILPAALPHSPPRARRGHGWYPLPARPFIRWGCADSRPGMTQRKTWVWRCRWSAGRLADDVVLSGMPGRMGLSADSRRVGEPTFRQPLPPLQHICAGDTSIFAGKS